jgi:hypothetical protein
MAKTYYSTRPPSLNTDVASQPVAALPTTQVNIPGNYYLKVNQETGTIDVEAGSDISIDSGSIVEIRAIEAVVSRAPVTRVIGSTILGSQLNLNIVKFQSRVESDIFPKGDNTYDLGEEGNAWKDLFTFKGEFKSEDNVENPFGLEYSPTDVYGAEFLGGSVSAANAQREQGAVFVKGGMGIEKDLNVGGWIYGRIRFAQTSLSILVTATNADFEYYPTFVNEPGQKFLFIDEVGIQNGFRYNPSKGRLTSDRVWVAEAEPATPGEGALKVDGGAYIEKNVIINDETIATPGEGALAVQGGVSIGENAIVESETPADASEGALRVEGGVSIGDNLVVNAADTAAPGVGAAIIEGGISVGDNAYVENEVEAEEVLPHSNRTGQVGSSSTQWLDGYLENIYTQFVKSTDGPIQIAPKDRLTEIVGDIRVRGGTNPIGTAPVVTNTLHVTMDGNDTNDGRAMDPSRACRTIGGALKSPYYQPGTQILVSAGRYLEDNPLRLKPYTSIRGSDIRTTFIEPINRTQDLFHLDSGTYLNYMTFLNGRSGLLEGPYEAEFNRGAYTTAFPPLTGSDRIDLFHSPYVQNCTNQSGPWLRDGTLFIPNQTVQVPQAVAVGSWEANTASIIVTITTGTIQRGMAINSGKQNRGFFDARTLMLANKDFLKEQVIAYVDKTFNSGSFSYDQAACSRDLGLIINSISVDMLYNSNSDSTFAGLQYWSQGSVSFPQELTTTTAAINYLRTEATALLSGAPATIVDGLITEITNILSSSSYLVGITDSIVINGLPSTDPSYVSAYETLLANKSALATSVNDWITTTYPGFVYNTATCKRDVGYIIDSVAFDLLHGGNKQSIKSGIYYYNYDAESTQVPNEIPQVSAAYFYLKSIIPSIIKRQPVPTTYQTATNQVFLGQEVAGDYEVEVLQDKLDYITSIIRKGPSYAEEKEPINLEKVASEEAENAFNMLVANTDFIKAEVIAFINETTNNFNYSREKCSRDVGILVENISYDASFGGNEKAVESGLAYYDGVISRIAGQEAQTIAAIDYLNELCQDVIVNNTCTDLYAIGPVTTATYSQIINTVLTGGTIAGPSIDRLFETVTTIIADGPDVIPELTKSSGPDAAYVAAETLLEANRRFIQEDTINYINNLVKEFPYSEMKCRRDTKLIVDAIAQDLLYPTVSMSQSTFAGIQYWNQGNYTGDIEAQLQPTLNAIEYLKELSGKVARNIRFEDDLIPRYQTSVPQNVSLEPSTTATVVMMNPLFDTVLEIVSGRTTGWTDRIISNGTATTFDSVLNAYDILQANKEYLGAEIVAFVNATHPDFTYNTTTCARDVGLIIDAIGFDLVHGGNKQAVQAGFSYYQFTTSTSAIHGQSTQTVAAFNRIFDIVDEIMLNQPVATTTGTKLTQVFGLTSSTIVEVAEVRRAISTITTIINSGPDVAAPPANIAFTASTSSSVLAGYELLVANKDFIADEVINYINWNYNFGSFIYNEEKCYRDVGLIVDAVAQDVVLLGNAKSVEAGLAYWSGGYNSVAGQENTTTIAINHAKDIALKIIANIPVTPQPSTKTTQVINPFFQYGGDYMPQQNVARCFKIITDIIERGPQYAPPVYDGSGLFAYIGVESPNDVKLAPVVTSISNANYDETLCRRDSEFIIDGTYFDVVLGTNYNAVTAGNAYKRGTISSLAVIRDELRQTKAAIEFIKAESETVMSASATAVERSNESYDEILNILSANPPSEIVFRNPTGVPSTRIAAKNRLISNKEFIKLEITSWIEEQIENGVSPFANFTYDRQKCARDVGYIVDALCYDILYGGNSAIRDCARAYFTKDGISTIPGEASQSIAAFNYMSTLAQNIIQGISVTPTQRNYLTTDLTGENGSPAEAATLDDLVSIITDVLTANNLAGLPLLVTPAITWAPIDLQNAVTALDAAKATIIDDTIDVVNDLFDGNVFRIGLSTSTNGFGLNATLYFGDTLIFPYRDAKVDELSVELTGTTSTWHLRKVDQIGSMGGSLVDGAVISSRSPIQSFVYDAFTQVNQGGRGVHIKRDGYAQLVSVFTVFCSIGVEVESGGIASIVNSNANFGNICLQAKGYGKRKFTGHIYNPVFKAYPESPDPTIATSFPDSEYFDQYYPTGFWPNEARVRVFLPDLDDRPHISLVMEVVAPETVVDFTGAKVPQLNEQGFPGFLNAAPTTSTLSTGSIVLNGIDTTGISIGHSLYVRDQFGFEYDSFPYLHDADGNPVDALGNVLEDPGLAPPNPNYLKRYSDTGTVVTDLGYQAVTLNKALTNGGGDPANTEYFDLYFCGNAYYTVLSSEISENPKYNRQGQVIPPGINILSTASTGLATDQIAAHVSSLERLQQVVVQIINNEEVTNTTGNTNEQIFKPLVANGGLAEQFIINRFTNIINIVEAANLNAAEAVVPAGARVQEGTPPLGAGDAISLIRDNIEFMADEISAYVQFTFGYTPEINYDDAKCQRDVKIILERIIYDIETGANFNSVLAGLSYWNRPGAYHIVQLGENVSRTDLFPDGSTVNFYQRSYMSASGYVFEYVGAGIDYGALPQRGVADPKQGQEVVQLDSGKVFFTSTDQNGDFRIGPGLVISQATGVLSGRTFTRSLFANLTPFILAIESGS